MSDDLISRKDAIVIIENMIFEVGKDLSKSYLLQDARERIIRLNAAFNKEKVIEELKRRAGEECKQSQNKFGNKDLHFGMWQGLSEAIEIVWKGGIK